MADELAEMIVWAGAEWRSRIEDPEASEILAGCELDDPDLLPGEIPLHGVIWRLMAHGGELFAVHHAWITAEGGGVCFRPSITLGRSAAVAGVRALYILEGGSPRERRIRALQLLSDEVKTVQGIANLIPKDLDGLDYDPWEDAGRYAKEVGDELGALGKSRDSHMSDSELMTKAAAGFRGNSRKAKRQLETHWKLASATVHARVAMWGLDVLDEPTPSQLAKSWGAPAQVLEIAWDAWNRKRGADDDGRLPLGAARRSE